MAVKTSLRLTSIYNDDPKFFAVGGVPLQKGSEKVFSAKSMIFVRGSTDLLEAPVRIGQHLTVTGEFSHGQTQINGAFITKIVFDQPLAVQLNLPATGEAFIKFIAEEPDFKGIGNAKARELWRVFGIGIFTMLNNGTTDRLDEVLSEQSITALVAGYKKYENLRFARWFVERNIKHSVSRKVIKYHGRNTVDAIIDNPYELVNFGLSLAATDKLAQDEFSIKPDDARRLVAVVSSVIKQFTARHGHTLMHHADVKKRVLKIFNNDELLCKKALQVSHKSKVFVLNKHNGCYHHTPSLIMEKVACCD
jgi:exodeoxyribonuclease V alpha subunit